MFRFFVLTLLFVTTDAHARVQDFENALKAIRVASIRDLLGNVSPADGVKGTIAAASSRVHPDYGLFDWTRDSAITAIELVFLYKDEKNPALKDTYFNTLVDYLRAGRRKQMTPNLSGNPGDTGNGEPKWNLNLSPYSLSWGRPQNDGPALRAKTLTFFAEILIEEGQEDLVRKLFYDGRIPSETLLKADLEFVSHHWKDLSYEMWEECRGEHFSNFHQQRRALWVGAKLADFLNDPKAAEWYRSEAAQLREKILSHWRDDLGYFVESQDPALSYRNLDAAVILSTLDQDDDPFLRASDDRILSTVENLRTQMHDLYNINKLTRNEQDEELGDAIGRYTQDTYDGYRTGSQGNPWFLITAGFAEHSYITAQEIKKAERIVITQRNLNFLKYALRRTRIQIHPGDIIFSADPKFQKIIDGIRMNGDAYMRRILYHAHDDGSLSEQMNKENGYMQGAEKLTWSCAATLSALRERDNLHQLLK
ncbi:MAG: hypothetical protein JWQ35_765 [Bacteriovoracaceae bacterium]|nr:hypothetical protein [Bacteriovoracaceae bacterium]